MREILFRGKRIDNDEWVEGSLVCWPDDDGIDTIVCFNEDAEKGALVGEHIEVDRKTVGQFTGLLDKSGKKIFEGDVVRYTLFEKFLGDDLLSADDTSSRTQVVRFDNGTFYPIQTMHCCDDYWYSWALDDFEVIGNKYEE